MIIPADFSSVSQLACAKTDRIDRAAASRQEALYDERLVHRFNAGDDVAFVEIMARHRERMFSIAFGLLKNHADAEEVTQDTFIRAHRGLVHFRGDSSLYTWLHRITLNLARNRYWYFFRRRRHETLSLNCAIKNDSRSTLSDFLAVATTPAHSAANNEFSALITACMQQLDAPSREILTLRVFLGHTYGEIAQELGIREGTVKSRIARARERLRMLLAEACPEFEPDARPVAWLEPAQRAGGSAVMCI